LICSVNTTQTHAQSTSTSFNLPRTGDIGYANYNSTFMPWTLKEAIVPLWIEFADQHGISYESIGKSSGPGNWDILAFKFGNPNGSAIMINAHLHGNEQYGYEVLYSLANWLVSSDPTVQNILENTYVILIPIVDYRWARTNYNHQTVPDPYLDIDDNQSSGVDLNRNFSPSWLSELIEQQYSGTAPDSEPESQALIAAWNKFQPRFYWTLNQGSTRVYTEAIGTTGSQNADLNGLKAILPNVAAEIGVQGPLLSITVQKAFGNCYGGFGKGYAIDGASSHGAAGVISEIKTGWAYTDEIRADLNSGETFKQAKAIFVAMAQTVEPPGKALYTASLTDPMQTFNPEESAAPSVSVNPQDTPSESKTASLYMPGNVLLIIFVIIVTVTVIGIAVSVKKRKR
jgi:hypothetical protein